MAQLPPKIPNMTQNWPPFPHQRMPTMATNFVNPTVTTTTTPAMNITSHQNQQPSWVDEFLDFSHTRRGTHRRSVSDSIAFLETSLEDDAEEYRNNNDNNNNNRTTDHNAMQDFDRLDDDQLLSMFADDVSMTLAPHATTSNPSTPSDQTCSNNNDEMIKTNGVAMDLQYQPKHEVGEVESSCKSDDTQATQQPSPITSNGDTFFDPKRVKRILANRQSAQRSRVRKLQYISELERSVTSLQTEVSALSPRVAFLDHQRLILNVDNSALKQRIAALAQDRIFKDAHQDALKKEIERLRQVYHQQNLKKMNTNNAQPLVQPSPRTDNTMVCTDN